MDPTVASKGLEANTIEGKAHQTHVEGVYDSDGEKGARNMKADAIEAETAELNLGVIAAVKRYPMASLWAFIFSCTIVSWLPLFWSREAPLTW